MISFIRTITTIWLVISLSLEGITQYFQQEVDYSIAVTLDTRQHVLRGHWQMRYQNNSPDTLQTLILHLYPNAYSSRTTAFAKQQLRLGITDFHFAQLSDLGRIDSLDFQIDQVSIPWKMDKEHPDIASLNLIEPLVPGQSILISSPLRVKIPKAFSRLGHIENSYQITQWYPKPAVYDQTGWHPLPYLNQGEFYGEFGSFDVQITLPQEYLVAGTGILQSAEEKRLLDSLAAIKNMPLSKSAPESNRFRTWQYHAEDVHDFALFADTRFAVRKETTAIGDHDIDCWVFFTTVEQDLWERATAYLKDALHFYSDRIGDYPYLQMTAVQVPLGRDFGMEYPMITSINLAGNAKTLDDVLTHEVGHNWFYGVLGSNERKHPWMDEGLTTYYEYEYLKKKYATWSEHLLLYKPVAPDALSDEQRIQQHMTREKQLVPPDSDPEYQSDLQVFFGAYVKPALAFDMLQEYMGNAVFAAAMQEYFNTWKFRHPQPSDLRAILSKHCSCDLTWLFEGLLDTDRLIDYRIVDWKDKLLTVENLSFIAAPVHVLAFRDSRIVFSKWYDGFHDTRKLNIDIPEVDRIQVYDEVYTLDLTPANNVAFAKNETVSLSKLKVRIAGGKQYPGEKYLNLLPLLAWNDTDDAMAGLAVSNTYWPPGKLQWLIAPLYSTKTKTLTGMGELRYRNYSEIRPHYVELGFGLKSFHFAQDTHYGFFDRYLQITPRIRFGVEKKRSEGPVSHYLEYRFVRVRQNYGRGLDYDDFLWERKERTYGVHEFTYFRQGGRGLLQSRFETSAYIGKGFVRLSADMQHHIAYRQSNKGLDIHSFGGLLPYHKNPAANINFNLNGIQSNGILSRDFLYDEFLFARTASKGLASQLVFQKDAQVKTLYNGGIADRWILAAGLATDTPLPIPIQPYFDVALYNDPFEDGVAVSYSGGLALVIKKNVFEVYLPLIESKDIRNSLTYLDRDTFVRRISILLDLKAFHPFDYKGY